MCLSPQRLLCQLKYSIYSLVDHETQKLRISPRSDILFNQIVLWADQDIVTDIIMSYKVVDLRRMLQQRGLPHSGNKEALLSRLTAYDVDQ